MTTAETKSKNAHAPANAAPHAPPVPLVAVVDAHKGCGGVYHIVNGKRELVERTVQASLAQARPNPKK